MLTANPMVFWLVTVGIFGGFAFLTGQSLGNNWRSGWMVPLYALLLAAGNRFILYGLFNGALFNGQDFLLTTLLMAAICLGAWRFFALRKKAHQYPWLVK